MSRKAPDADDRTLFDADQAEQALASLSLAAPPIEPPPGLWAKIAREMGEAPAGVAVARLAEGKWRALAPGVEIKPLWGKRTFLIRCEPGATVPRHRHRTFEHTLILSGDIAASDGDYGHGDYLGNPEGWHEAWSTRAGCLVLVQYDA
jgi:anti-sigma factor ChrR (cupin superfamily)